MRETSEEVIHQSLNSLKEYFRKGATRDINTRIGLLRKLRGSISSHQNEIAQALHKDLRKSEQESFISETGLVLKEIDIQLRNLKKWAKPKRVRTPLYLLPSSSHLKFEPKGTVLIIAPWNYPFQLLMTPLVGAIAAGNTVLLKPSEFSESTNPVMGAIVSEVFTPEHVSMVHGGKTVNQILFQERYDLIYFTGSPYLGKIVMKAAAENLTPVVLELGGKSPCIVDKSADLKITAKRIAWGKTVNVGQTCIAPDYLLVHKDIAEELQKGIAENWEEMFGADKQKSQYLGRIVNDTSFERLKSYLTQGTIVAGGEVDANDRFIAPTLLRDVDLDGTVMQDEIFGPVLPMIVYEDINEAIKLINSRETPLSYYYFGEEKNVPHLLDQNTSGGVCINDLLIHISNHHLPFGGEGNSGIGRCHGKYSFEAFSNARAIMKSPTWIDLPFRYAPFKGYRFVKKLLS